MSSHARASPPEGCPRLDGILRRPADIDVRKPTRPEWIAHRDFTPVEPVADGALLAHARGFGRAAE